MTAFLSSLNTSCHVGGSFYPSLFILFLLGDHLIMGIIVFTIKGGYYIDWIMGYQIGDYSILFRKAQQVLHHHFYS
jgi:hypothetical protein